MSFTLKANHVSATALELDDANPWRVGGDGPTLPLFQLGDEYADPVDGEGGKRTRLLASNGEGTLPLQVEGQAMTNAAFWGALTGLQQAVSLCERYGGTLKYVPAAGGVGVTYVLESISLTELPQDYQLSQRVAFAVLSFVARPLGKLDPVALVANATSSAPLHEVNLAGITGSADAQLAVTVTDQAGVTRDHLEVAVDDDWDGVSSNLIDSASFTALAGAATTRTGNYNAGVLRANIGGQATAICEKTGLTHRGRQRVKIRAYVANANNTGLAAGTNFRLAYRFGSGSWIRGNPPAVHLGFGWQELDLGVLRVPVAQQGSLAIRIEAWNPSGTGWPTTTVDFDYAEVWPLRRATKVRAPLGLAGPIANPAARDEFNGSGAALAGVALPTGGTWSGSGDADDFGYSNVGTNYAYRSVAGDVAAWQSGRFERAAAGALTDASVAADVTVGQLPNSGQYIRGGIFARFTNASNYLGVSVTVDLNGTVFLDVVKVIANARTFLNNAGAGGQSIGGNYLATRRLNLIVLASGFWGVLVNGSMIAGGYDVDLATGGTLATGGYGLWDWNPSTTVGGRIYQNFIAGAPDLTQHVTAANGAIVVDHQSAARADGTKPGDVTGRYLTCAPAGRENRTHKLVVKLRRVDVDRLPDNAISDQHRVDVSVTPRVVVL